MRRCSAEYVFKHRFAWDDLVVYHERRYWKLQGNGVRPEEKKSSEDRNTPYPSDFDRGIINAMLVRFKPKDSVKCDVVLDSLKETRLKGANSCTYTVSW